MIVYWLKRERHTDVWTEGYVGVTSHQDYRSYVHCWAAKERRHKNPHLQNALSLYDDVEFSILYEDDQDECLAVERLFRPRANIGWNILPGGGLPPVLYGKRNAAGPRSDEFRKKWLGNKYGLGKKHPGTHWYNDGKVNIRAKVAPRGFVPGMIKKQQEKRGEAVNQRGEAVP